MEDRDILADNYKVVIRLNITTEEDMNREEFLKQVIATMMDEFQKDILDLEYF